MDELYRKYAKVLLENCLKIEKKQPLFISYNKDIEYFVDIVKEIANYMGIKDIYLNRVNPKENHRLLVSNKSIDELKKLPNWNREIWNEYANKDAAFLMLLSLYSGLMSDVDSNRLSEMTKYSLETSQEFDDARSKSSLSWCIAAVPNKEWAKELFPDKRNALKILWDKIFEVCLIKEDNPGKAWDERLNTITKRAKILNNYQFKYLKYKSDKGTDLVIELPNNHIWQTGLELINNKKNVLVNFPTEEIFTSPLRSSANGIVYSTKPLNYNDIEIDDFWIKFKDGKAIDCKAKKGEDTLKMLINITPGSDYLGEVAIVQYDSPISNTGMVFKETLFDENASCHLALGDSFPECIEDGLNKSKEELMDMGLNDSLSHVDFMIGDETLSIIGVTKDNKEYKILENGNFTKLFN